MSQIRYTVLPGVRECVILYIYIQLTLQYNCAVLYDSVYNFKSQIAVFSYSLVTLTCVCFPKQAFILLLYIPKE